MRQNKIEYKGPVIESYENDPTTVSADQIHTKIIYYIEQ